MKRIVIVAAIFAVALLPGATQAQIQEMRQNIFGMD